VFQRVSKFGHVENEDIFFNLVEGGLFSVSPKMGTLKLGIIGNHKKLKILYLTK